MAHLKPYLGKKPIWVVLSITKKKSELRRQKRRWLLWLTHVLWLTVPSAAGFRVGVADVHCMPVSSGSVLFPGLQERAKPWSCPLQLAYMLEETELEGNNKSVRNVSSLGEEGVVPHAGERGLLPPSSTMIEACGAGAVK